MSKPPTFAEMVAALPPPTRGRAVEWPSPIAHRVWTDEHCVEWSMRGSELTKPIVLRRLVLDLEVRLLLWWCDPRPVLVPDDQRVCMWQRLDLESAVLGTGRASYRAAEFRTEDRSKMLIVQAFC